MFILLMFYLNVFQSNYIVTKEQQNSNVDNWVKKGLILMTKS